MVVGVDLWKDSVKQTRVTAFVSSVNAFQENKLNSTKYFSRCMHEPRRTDFITSIGLFMRDALVKFRESNGQLPQYIILYRDGVSDGQIDLIREAEVTQLNQAFSTIDPNWTPFLQFILVKKRGNTKFFKREADSGHINNAEVGTCISEKVVARPGREFYMISQSSKNNTVSPTHFVMLDDPQGILNLERLQILTYKLMHMYYNWAGQIRVPAHCQYAFKLARLVGDSLHDAPRPELDDKLFYL